MKYLFINSVAGFGSTGRIAAESCRELMKDGHQCVLAFGREKANCDDIKTVQANLGHATAQFTLDVYGHVTQKMKQDSANRKQLFYDQLTKQ